ncbi:efflux transporter outer membrane subunit [Chitinibacteraceae bacterium HSL-7]
MKRALLPLAVLLALGGCVLPSPPNTQALYTEELTELEGRQSWQGTQSIIPVSADWASLFNDAALTQLISEALEHNRNLRAAAARIDAAAARVTIDSAGIVPQVNLAARGGVKAGDATNQVNGFLLNVSWELDLWGRVRATARASEAQYASAEADYYWAQQAIAASVAQYWFSAIELNRMIDLQQGWLAEQQKLVTLTSQRVKTGIDSPTAETDQLLKLQAGQDQLAQLRLARTQTLQALEVLVGRYPAAELQTSATLPALPPALAAGTPTDLLERRPDVIAAERRVAAAFYATEAAKAARLPRLNLAAGLSVIESDVFVLKDIDNPNLGGSVSLLAPIFNGGALKAQVDAFSAQQREAVAGYGQVAINAIREVEASLAAEQSLAVRRAVLTQSSAAAQRQVDAEVVRVRVGKTSPLALAARQQALLTTEMTLLAVQAQSRRQRVATHLALGGDARTGDVQAAKQ